MAVLLATFIVHYFFMAKDGLELIDLRKETRSQKVQIQKFASNITDLEKQMTRLKDLDAKLRVITDIGPAQESYQVMGIGGAEEPGSGTAFLGRQIKEDTFRQMDEDLKGLKSRASIQELSFEELAEAMKDRRSLWASTPSIWPVRGWLTSRFGNRLSPFSGNVQMHKGIDIASRRDTPITATAAGVVSYVGYDSGLGKVIKINHGYGMKTLFGHMSKTAVKIGQKVKRGDTIGFVGNTGLSTGPHLHYAVQVKNVPVNPLRYILN